MRPLHSTITPGVVHRQARTLLQGVFDWTPVGRSVTVTDLLDVLLLMAASTASLFAVVRRFFPVQSRDRVAGGQSQSGRCPAAGPGTAPGPLRDRRVLPPRPAAAVAVGHRHPLRPVLRPAHGVRGGRPETAGHQVVLRLRHGRAVARGRRYTVAVCPLAPKTKPHEIVRTLWQQIAAHGLKVRGVVLDSAFDSGATLLLLQEYGVAYTVPLQRKGTTRNARNRLFEGRHQQVRWAEWFVKDTTRQVRTRTVLWKGRPRTMVLAFGGWTAPRAGTAHRHAARQKRLYQRRFAIETSYRQKNQAQAVTTSRDPVYRLLLEGLGYLIRQVWVVLTEQLRRAHASADAWVGALPLQRLNDWLVHQLTTLHPEELSIPAP